jgi:hypothetical protein
MQLLKSSGYPRLDSACIESVIDVLMLPATVSGQLDSTNKLSPSFGNSVLKSFSLG